MLAPDALRQLLTHLVALAFDPPNDAAEYAADELLADITTDREQTGRIMLAMASLIVFQFHETHPNPETAIETLTTIGDPIPNLHEFLAAMLDACRHGDKISVRAVLLTEQITRSREDAGISLWILATYLALGLAEAGEPDAAEHAINAFVDSCVRQELIDATELAVDHE